MTVSGRKQTIANGSNRPESVIQDSCRECPVPDRKPAVHRRRGEFADHALQLSQQNA